MNKFNLVRKGWHRKQLSDGTYMHIIKTGRPCWRVCVNSDRSQYPGRVKDTKFLGWGSTLDEAFAKAAA